MKVSDIINTHFSLANKDLKFLVKPKGSDTTYYSGNGSYIRPNVADMTVQRWLIGADKHNNPIFVIIVEQDLQFEEEKRKFIERDDKNE
jgi:hypothetical protein